MESLSGINHPSYLLNLSLHYRPSFTKPISSFSLKSTSSPTTNSILRGVRASASSSSSVPPSLNSKTQEEKPLLETPKPVSFLIKTTCVAIFTAALVLARFKQPSIAAPIVIPTVKSVETTENEETKKPMEEEEEEEEEEDELILFGNLDKLNDDIAMAEELIRAEELMQAKAKAKKFEEAVSILDRMIKIRPSKTRWLLWRAQLLKLNGDYDLAKLGFEQVLEKDPLSVEAYRGLMIMTSKAEMREMNKRIESAIEICKKNEDVMYQELVKRIQSAIEICKKNEDVMYQELVKRIQSAIEICKKNKEDVRDFKLLVAEREFKLLVAEIWVIEGKYTDALKIYQELVKEDPEDSRLYLYQWHIYTLLEEEGEADIQFEKYRKLLPKELQEDACFLKENKLATREAFFSQMAEENETVGSKK